MRTHTATSAACILLIAGTVIADHYDFFDLSRYPAGGALKEGVELYTVKETGGAPGDYTRRVVKWWPRPGVDFVQVAEGMPLREWTLKPDLFDADKAPEPDLDWQTFEHEQLDMPTEVGDAYVRQIEGYLHPPRDGLYTFKIAADDHGSFFLSTDDSRDNVRLVCYSCTYSHRYQFGGPGQTSQPIPLKKGHSYYFELVHEEGHAHDNAMVVWSTPEMDEEIIGASALSTLDGRSGTVIEKRASLEGAELPVSTIRLPHQQRRFSAHLIGFDGIGNDLFGPHRSLYRMQHDPGPR